MSTDSRLSEQQAGHYKPRTKTLIGVGLLFFLLVGSIAWLLCNLRIQYSTQNILNQHRDVEQAWLDKTLDNIRIWRNELVEQSRLISVSELLRLFVRDARNLSNDKLELLPLPETLQSSDDSLRSLAEQFKAIQDLLRDFTARRAWTDARLLLPDAKILAAREFSSPISDFQYELAKEAVEKGRPLFGPIRHEGKHLVMDMADPLQNVLGSHDSAPIAVLLLTIPMEKVLASFLSGQSEQNESLLPRIVNPDKGIFYMIFSRINGIAIEPVNNDLKRLENLPFARRTALAGAKDVYSMAGRPTSLDWLLVVEIPAAEIDEHIQAEKMEIYGLGALASLGLALLAAWLWARHTSRKHEADAIKFENLYNTINNQKMVLDSINASFHAGLVLVDAWGRVQFSNPAFSELCCKKTEIEKGMPLIKILPNKVALKLLEDINQVSEAGKSASDEVQIKTNNPDNPEEKRLYRVTFYPYYSQNGSEKKQANGCVAIFQDITEFRRKALDEIEKVKNERKKQETLIAAFVRAVESVDPYLLGHSDKMAKLAALLAKQLQFDPAETETLDQAAKLSQVGKIYVPRELLAKKGKLSPEELAELRKAPEHADKILHELHFELPVRETVAMMGEKIDGSGAPKGLKGREITMPGRALAVVNAFIAMTSPRAWRVNKAMSVTDAIRDLRNNPGFDQEIVDALANIPLNKLEQICTKR